MLMWMRTGTCEKKRDGKWNEKKKESQPKLTPFLGSLLGLANQLGDDLLLELLAIDEDVTDDAVAGVEALLADGDVGHELRWH